MIINYSNQEVIKGKKSIFLAGPTPREKDIISWRREACDYIEELGFDGVVFDPEYSSWQPKEDYVDQASWEREALSNASIIVFWVPRSFPDMPAFTTNVEFGYWIHTGKILYGRPTDAPKTKYLDWLYKLDTKQEPFDNMKELLSTAVKLANERGVVAECQVLPLKDRKVMTK